MKTIFALPLLALGLAACTTVPVAPYDQGPQGYPEPAPYPQPFPQPYPQPYPQPGPQPSPLPGAPANYRAIGTEPFWDLTIGHDMAFTDRGNGVSVVERTPPVQRSTTGEIYRGGRIVATIAHARCSDGMSDREYPDTVNVIVDGRPYRGCGGAAAYAEPSPGGQIDGPPIQGAFNLTNTNWRVVAINGAQVPPSGYYLNFMPDRVSGRFGCNSLGAGYRVTGNMLYAGAIMATQMACPASFEAQGTAIMAQPMTIMESGDRLTLSNRIGTIELTRAR